MGGFTLPSSSQPAGFLTCFEDPKENLSPCPWKIRKKNSYIPFKKQTNPIATTKPTILGAREVQLHQFLTPTEALELHPHANPVTVTSRHSVSALTIRGKVQTTHWVRKATQPPSWRAGRKDWDFFWKTHQAGRCRARYEKNKYIYIYIYRDLCCSKVIKNGLGQKIGMSILHNISNDILAPNKISRSFPWTWPRGQLNPEPAIISEVKLMLHIRCGIRLQVSFLCEKLPFPRGWEK